MSLIKNSLWNIGGYIIPAIITVPALGILGRYLGGELFGVFTLALAIVGYSSIFDAGLTRAVIREISIYRNDEKEKINIIATASSIILMLGLVAALLLCFCSEQITILLKISPEFYTEVSLSLKILSISIPLFLITQIWLAILEGEEKFALLNVYKTITGSCLSLFPALFIFFEAKLENAILGLVLARFVCFVSAFYICKENIIKAKLHFHKETIKRLFMFGGWITISNIISPIMAYFDRFIVSNQLGAQVVALYTAPSEIVSRLGIIPGGFARALFPRLSYATTQEERNKNKKMIYLLLLCLCLPILIIGGIFSEHIMVLWMGPGFSGTSAYILSILLVGFLFNSLAQVPFASIQSQGFAKVTAFIHMGELIPYLSLLFFLIHHNGVIGAALAWTLRMLFDYIVLMFFDMKIALSRSKMMP